jgi:hypothetical protein
VSFDSAADPDDHPLAYAASMLFRENGTTAGTVIVTASEEEN